MFSFWVDRKSRNVVMTPRIDSSGNRLVPETALVRHFLNGGECFITPFLPGESGSDAQWRTIVSAAMRYYSFSTQNNVLISDTGGIDDRNYNSISTFSAHNVIPVTCSIKFNAEINQTEFVMVERPLCDLVRNWVVNFPIAYPHARYGFCECTPRESGLRACRDQPVTPAEFECLRHQEERRLRRDPHHFAVQAFVSGSGYTGTLEALQNMQLNKMNPSEKSEYITWALIESFAVGNDYHLTAPVMTYDQCKAQTFDETKSAGFFNVAQYFDEVADKVIVMTNTCKQGEAWVYAATQVEEIAETVAKGIKSSYYDRDWFPTLAAKIAVKPEVREVGSNATKVRVFFILSMIRLFVDKIVFGPVFPQFYGQGNVGIGHSWAKGGAQDLAEALQAEDPLTAWFLTDVVKLDQSLMAPVLTAIFSFPAVFYEPADTEAYKIMRAFMTYAADDVAATLVKWTGFDYRLVIGVMFSGLFGTSWGDTIYVDIVLRTLNYHIEDYLEANSYEKELEEFHAHRKQYKIYGDNIVMSMPWSVLQIVTESRCDDDGNPRFKYGVIQHHFSERWGMEIKLSETFIHPPGTFYTNVMHRRENGVVYDTQIIGIPGVNYLKRYFIKVPLNDQGLFVVLPFRPTVDYFTKSITTASSILKTDTLRTHISRWTGLLVDTAGTNLGAWNFLQHLIRGIYALHHQPTPEWSEIMSIDLLWNNADLNKRFRKMGFVPEVVPFRNRSDLVKKFVRPKYVHYFDPVYTY